MLPLIHYIVLSAPQADRSTPEKTLQSFLDALIKLKVADIISCIEGAKPSAFTEEFAKNTEKDNSISLSASNLKTSMRTDGTIEISYQLVVNQNGNEVQRDPDKAILRKNNGQWQLVPPTKENGLDILQRMRTGKRQPGDLVSSIILPFAYPEAGIAARKGAQKTREQENNVDKELAALREAEIKREIGRVGRLVDWEKARSARRSSPPVLVGQTEDAFRTALRLKQLQELKENEVEPYTQKSDGFTSAQLKTALADAQKAVATLQTTKALMTVPHGTPIKVLNYRPVTLGSLDVDSPLKLALVGDSVQGIWQVEVQEGALQGTALWTDTVVGMTPTFGDVVVVRLTAKPTEAVPVAVDLEAGDALLPGGRVGDAKALARFDRLVREKRFVLLPPNTTCDFLDIRTDGSCYLIRPSEGAFKGKTLLVRAEHAALKK